MLTSKQSTTVYFDDECLIMFSFWAFRDTERDRQSNNILLTLPIFEGIAGEFLRAKTPPILIDTLDIFQYYFPQTTFHDLESTFLQSIEPLSHYGTKEEMVHGLCRKHWPTKHLNVRSLM
jgi:hypothetical protein